jgi:integrase
MMFCAERRRFNKLLQTVGMPVGRENDGLTFHSFRRFMETHCQNVDNRPPQDILDAWMGHAGDGAMSTRYHRWTPDDSQNAMRKVSFDLSANTLTLQKGDPDATA